MDGLVQLVQRYRAQEDTGERERLADDFFCQVGPEIHRYIRSRVPREAVNDALQETLLAILDGLPVFRGRDDASLWSWCYRIASHKCAEQFRGRKMRQLTIVDTDLLREALEGVAEEGPLSSEDRSDLEEALKLVEIVEPPCRHHLWDRYVVGMRFGDMGRELGITEDAARMRVARCLELAQKLLRQ